MKFIFRVFVLCCLCYRIVLGVKPGKIQIRPKEIISLEVELVKDDPDENYLKRGSTKKITCRGSQRYQKIEWYDPDGDEIKRDSNQRVFVQDAIVKSKAQALVLTIKEALVEDTGVWECRSGELLQKIPLCVIDPLVFVDTPTEVTIDEGRAITLTCQARGDPDPKIVWYRNGDVISETDEKIYINTKYNQQGLEGLLTIKSLTAEDGGTYVCEAIQENSELEDCIHAETTNITLNINQRPKFNEGPAPDGHKYVFAQDDEEVQLVCNPSAYPKPKFRWFKEKGDAWSEFPEKQFKVSDDGTQSVLFITFSSTNDQKFRCMANNKYGSASMVFELKELVKPSRITEYSVSNATDTTIWFNVTGIQDCEPCDLSGFEIQYFHKKTAGSPKETQWKRSHIKNCTIDDIEDSMIMLDGLKPDTEYWVRIRPYNSLGHAPWSLPLLVSTTTVDNDYEDLKELAPDKELLQATTDFGMFYGFLLTGIIVVFGAACIFFVQKV